MKVTDTSVICFHLQVLHGITVKSVERRKERLFISGAKVFGVPLESLPRRYIPEFGLVPWWVRAVASEGVYCPGSVEQLSCETCLCFSFLVDACSFLLDRAGTVGLFRKPGSLPRIKTLRVRIHGVSDCRGGCCHNSEALTGSFKSFNRFLLNFFRQMIVIYRMLFFFKSSSFDQQAFASDVMFWTYKVLWPICVCSRWSWIMERRVCPQPSPMTWPLSSNSSAGSFQNLCFPQSSKQLCSNPRRYPTRKTRPQPSSCCPVCCLPEALPACIICSLSSPESLRGLVLIFSAPLLHFCIVSFCAKKDRNGCFSDATKTWWPPQTSLRSLHRAFYLLPTRQKCLKVGLS